MAVWLCCWLWLSGPVEIYDFVAPGLALVWWLCGWLRLCDLWLAVAVWLCGRLWVCGSVIDYGCAVLWFSGAW